MTDQEQQSTETILSINQNLTSENNEKLNENKSNPSDERSTRRITMPQDVRYSTEQSNRDKLMEKYNNYRISDTNNCYVRYLIDSRQKKILFGRNEEENSNMNSLGKTFDVNIFPGYQHATKHSFKIYGTEANVRKCLIEIMNRIVKRSNQTVSNTEKFQQVDVSTEEIDEKSASHPTSIFVTTINHNSSITQETKPIISTTNDDEKSAEKLTPNPHLSTTEETKPIIPNTNDDEKSASHPTSIFVTTINPDSSITQETKPIILTTNDDEKSAENSTTNPHLSTAEETKPIVSTTNEEKTNNNDEQRSLKFIPVERKLQYTFILLISSQGQEVLKKNWNFFAGSLQQRLNVTVTNPLKLSKFGDKQIYNELPITGEIIENLTDACLQIVAFINDVLGVPIQPYKQHNESIDNDNNHYQRQKSDNHNYRSSPSSNNHQGRIFFNRSRSNVIEQVLHIRSDCVARIIGTRGTNLKRIQTKCHLRDMIVGRQANDNGYVECTLYAYQMQNIHFAIDTIRSFLRNENDNAIIVIESNHGDSQIQNSPHLQELARPNTEHSSFTSTNFTTKNLNLGNGNNYPQPTYNFQNTPSFDFTHQATSASRKTDKRPGDLNDNNKTPTEYSNQSYENISSSNYSSNSPRHKSKRSCPETKEIDCLTDDGFWIQKQFYHALDDSSKQVFDSLIEKLEKIRLAYEENAARKQQRLVGRNRSNKSRVHNSSITYSNEDTSQNENDLTIKTIENNNKVDQSTDVNEEKENKQESSTVSVDNE